MLLFAGKTQRLLAEFVKPTSARAYLPGAPVALTQVYREVDIDMPPTEPVSAQDKRYDFADDLVMAPPSAAGFRWMRRFPATKPVLYLAVCVAGRIAAGAATIAVLYCQITPAGGAY